MVMCDFERMR